MAQPSRRKESSKPLSQFWSRTSKFRLCGEYALFAIVRPYPLTVTSFFGANTRGNSGKLQELGWKPKSPSFFEEVERDVENALKA